MPIIYTQDQNNDFNEDPKHNFTSQQTQEFIKCIRDIVYFAENYCFITTIHSKKEKIKLRDYQKNILLNYKNNRFNIVQQTRQTGISLINNIFALYEVLFSENKTICICSKTIHASNINLNMIKFMYENLPEFLKPHVIRYNNSEILLSNGNQILSKYCNENSFRGVALSCLIVDDFAYVEPNISENFIDVAFQSVSHNNGKFIISSTKNIKNRKTNTFWKMWCRSIDGFNEFVPYYVDWKMVSDRDQKWKTEIINNIGKIRFDQEYEVSYTHSDPFAHSQDGEKLYTPKEMANIFNVSTSTVARWRTKNRIKGIEVSQRKFYYTQQDIDKLLAPVLEVETGKNTGVFKPWISDEEFISFDPNERKDLLISLDQTPTRNVYKIELGNLPEEVARKYINELVEKLKKHFE